MPLTTKYREIKIAARLTDALLAAALPTLKKGVSEKEVAEKIVELTKQQGCGLSFYPIVAFGRWTAYPHHKSSRRRLRRGDLILIDLGAKHKGFCADLTRMFIWRKPSPKSVKLVKLVQEAQNLARRKTKVGVDYREADQLVRNYFISRGVKPEHILHGLGHGLGRRVHVNFTLSARSAHPKGPPWRTLRVGKTGRLKIGDIFTLEPGIYIKGWGGVRIEDTVVLTARGVKNLTHFPRRLKTLAPSSSIVTRQIRRRRIANQPVICRR